MPTTLRRAVAEGQTGTSWPSRMGRGAEEANHHAEGSKDWRLHDQAATDIEGSRHVPSGPLVGPGALSDLVEGLLPRPSWPARKEPYARRQRRRAVSLIGGASSAFGTTGSWGPLEGMHGHARA